MNIHKLKRLFNKSKSLPRLQGKAVQANLHGKSARVVILFAMDQ